jgi:hypothetical protein
MISLVRLFFKQYYLADCEGSCGLCSRDDKKCHSQPTTNYIAKLDLAVPLAGGTRINDGSGNGNALEINLLNRPPIL